MLKSLQSQDQFQDRVNVFDSKIESQESDQPFKGGIRVQKYEAKNFWIELEAEKVIISGRSRINQGN